MLMTRENFRESVFRRDNHSCVICGSKNKIDAHHIIERRLWSDGGYYLDNGATLCDNGTQGCHYKAETTELSVEDIRLAAGITNNVLPDDMYSDHIYDKWGNQILSSGQRTIGPLFHDESVQKVLRNHPNFENLFVEYVKYPRTWHLPFSPGATKDDRIIKDCSQFEGKRVIITEKKDGENFSGYTNYCHARSVDGRHHYTRDWAKNFWSQRSYELPEKWRICAENLYAVHSIRYDNLPSYLLAFSIWNEKNECLDWDSSVEWFQLLDIPHVPVLYDGIWNENLVKNIYNEKEHREIMEGFVVRVANSFHYSQFYRNVAKYVRSNHVTSNVHWFYGKNNHEINQLEEKKNV